MGLLAGVAGATDRAANEFSKFANREHANKLQAVRDARLAEMANKEWDNRFQKQEESWNQRYDKQREDKVSDTEAAASASVNMKRFEFAVESRQNRLKAYESQLNELRGKQYNTDEETAEIANLSKKLENGYAELDALFSNPQIVEQKDFKVNVGGGTRTSTAANTGWTPTPDQLTELNRLDALVKSKKLSEADASRQFKEYVARGGKPVETNSQKNNSPTTGNMSGEESSNGYMDALSGLFDGDMIEKAKSLFTNDKMSVLNEDGYVQKAGGAAKDFFTNSGNSVFSDENTPMTAAKGVLTQAGGAAIDKGSATMEAARTNDGQMNGAGRNKNTGDSARGQEMFDAGVGNAAEFAGETASSAKDTIYDKNPNPGAGKQGILKRQKVSQYKTIFAKNGIPEGKELTAALNAVASGEITVQKAVIDLSNMYGLSQKKARILLDKIKKAG